MLEGGKIIKKILSMLIICIIFLNSFLVVAIPTNNKIKNNPLNSQEFQLKMNLLGNLILCHGKTWYGYKGYITNQLPLEKIT